MDREKVLAAYLNRRSSKPVSEEDIDFDYYHYYTCEGNQYLILKEGDEEYDYLKNYSDELIEQDKIDLENAGFGYLIQYIHFDEMYENDDLIDHGFDEFTYDHTTYYILEE